MAEDLGEKLRQILSNPSALEAVSSMLREKKSEISDTGEVSDDSFENTIRGAVSSLSSGSDKRINLLSALKPYMRQTRADNIDKAIKMLKLTKLSSVFKDL